MALTEITERRRAGLRATASLRRPVAVVPRSRDERCRLRQPVSPRRTPCREDMSNLHISVNSVISVRVLFLACPVNSVRAFRKIVYV